MKGYDTKFFEYVNSGAIGSARAMLPHLRDQLVINSVLDVGCGVGAWLSVWKELGVESVFGVDGDYVDRQNLLISESEFAPQNLTEGFSLEKKFDLVQCLEVAEHIPASSADKLISGLVNHGEIILFSAAPKGQGGDHHINEQSYEYWRKYFLKYDYFAYDYIRPLVLNNLQIEPWYRYNMFLYIETNTAKHLSNELLASKVPELSTLKDISPIGYRIRKAAVRMLPTNMATYIAKIKERSIVRKRKNNLRR